MGKISFLSKGSPSLLACSRSSLIDKLYLFAAFSKWNAAIIFPVSVNATAGIFNSAAFSTNF